MTAGRRKWARLGPVTELPDFRIPHADKIRWMIETKGYALEPVPAREGSDPPVPGYCYTIGLPELVGFPEIVVFGLTPVAASGLIDQVVQYCIGGTEFPIDVEFTGLYDNDLRAALLTVDVATWAGLFETGVAWRSGDEFDLVQLVWPDRNGFLPTDPGFETRLVLAQPVLSRGDDAR